MNDLSPDLADPDRLLRVAVLSDTHRRATGGPDGPPPLPGTVLAELTEADGILHAGDVVTLRLLEQLTNIAPTAAVLGNNDHELVGVLPETMELTLAGVRVAMIHDSGSKPGRPKRLHDRFPRADIVVFGHSHDPVDDAGIEGQRLFNPGSPTQRRRQPHPTMGVLDLAESQITRHRIIAITG